MGPHEAQNPETMNGPVEEPATVPDPQKIAATDEFFEEEKFLDPEAEVEQETEEEAVGPPPNLPGGYTRALQEEFEEQEEEGKIHPDEA